MAHARSVDHTSRVCKHYVFSYAQKFINFSFFISQSYSVWFVANVETGKSVLELEISIAKETK